MLWTFVLIFAAFLSSTLHAEVLPACKSDFNLRIEGEFPSISRKARRYGCKLIQTNNDFETIGFRLKRYNTEVVDFFAEGVCQNEWSLENGLVPGIPPQHLSLLEPTGRGGILLDFMLFIDGTPQQTEVAQLALNRRDCLGRTPLDYLELMKVTRFAGDHSAQNVLRTLRNEMCARGAIHSTVQTNCTPKGGYVKN